MKNVAKCFWSAVGKLDNEIEKSLQDFALEDESKSSSLDPCDCLQRTSIYTHPKSTPKESSSTYIHRHLFVLLNDSIKRTTVLVISN